MVNDCNVFGFFQHFRHWFSLVGVLEVNVPLVHPHSTVGADDGDWVGGNIFPVLWHKSDTFSAIYILVESISIFYSMWYPNHYYSLGQWTYGVKLVAAGKD